MVLMLINSASNFFFYPIGGGTLIDIENISICHLRLRSTVYESMCLHAWLIDNAEIVPAIVIDCIFVLNLFFQHAILIIFADVNEYIHCCQHNP